MIANHQATWIGSRLAVVAFWLMVGGLVLAEDMGGPGGAGREPSTSQPADGIRQSGHGSSGAMWGRAGTTQPAEPVRFEPPRPPGESPEPPAEMRIEAGKIDAVDDAALEALRSRAAASTRPAGMPNRPALPPRPYPSGMRKPPAPGEVQPTPAPVAGPTGLTPTPAGMPQPAPEEAPAVEEVAPEESEPVPEEPAPMPEAAPAPVQPVPVPAGPVTATPAGVPATRPGHAPHVPTTRPRYTPPSPPPRPGGPPTVHPTPSPAPSPSPAPGGTPAAGTIDPKTQTPIPAINPKTHWKLPYNERPYFFNWNNTPLEKCCADLVEMSGLSMIGLETVSDQDKKTPITFQSLELQNFDQALTRFNLICQELGMGYWTLVRDGYLEIRQLSEWYRRMLPERMYDSLEAYRAAKLPPWEMASLMYVPKHQPGQRVAQTANDFVVDNCARAVLVPNSNQVQIRGMVYHIDRLLQILDRFDVATTDGRETRKYEVKYKSPADASSELQQVLIMEGLMGGSAGGAPAVPSPPVPPTPVPPGTPPSRTPRTVTPRPPAGPTDIGSTTSDEVDIMEPLSGNYLLVRASPAKHEKIKKLFDEYVNVPSGTTQKMKMIQLQYVDPNTMVDMITPLLGEPRVVQPPAPQPRPGQPPTPPPPPIVQKVNTRATLQPVPPSSILVKADDKEMAEIENLIKMLDVPSEEAKYQVVKLQHADASSVAMVLTNLITGQRVPGRPSPMGGMEGFKAVADNTTDRTLVISGSKQDLTEAQRLIKELDVNPAEGAAEHIVQLKNAEPGSVVQILTTRFGGGSAGGGYGRRGGYYGGYYGGGGGGQSLPQFIPNEESKMLVVICHDAMWPDISKLITELDEKSETLKTTRSYQIKHASAESVASLLSQALGGGRSYYGYRGLGGGEARQPSFLFNESTNLLLVTALEEDHVKAAELIEKLDQPSPADKAEFRAIELQKADAEYVAEKIEELFGGEGGSSRRRSSRSYDYYGYGGGYGSGAGGAPKVPVRVIPEPIGNRVLVQASDEDFEKAKTLAQQIDEEYTKQEYVRKTFVLENSDPWDVQQVIQSMFEAESVGGGRSGGYRSGYSSWSGGSSSSTPGGVKIAPMGNALVVLAPKDKMAEIEAFIKEIDSDPSQGNEIKMYRVKGTDYSGTATIARNLSALFNVPDSSGYGRSSGTKSSIKFIGDYGSNVLFVSAPKDKMPEIDKKVQEFLEAQGGKDTTMVIRHFAVTKARPQEVADMIQPILEAKYREMQEQTGSRRYYGYYGGGGPEVTVNKVTRKLMVMAPAELMTTVEQLIQEFDQASQATVTRTVVLKTAKAADIAPIVQEHMRASAGASSPGRRGSSRYRPWEFSGWGGWGGGSGGSSSSSQGDEELVVTAFDAGNSIILRGTEDKVYEAEQFVKMLDAGAQPEGPMIKVCQLKYADPYTVADYIEEVAGGGSSSGSDYLSGTDSTRRLSSRGSGAAITVKPDYMTKRLIVAAPVEKWPLIEQIIEIQEKLAFDEANEPALATGDVVPGTYGGIKKFYTVKGPAKEIAQRLDDILYGLFGMKGPIVKYFQYTNQVVIDGDPKYFKTAEEWLAKLEQNPPPVKLMVAAKRPGVSADKVLDQFLRLAPASLSGRVNVRRLESGGKSRDPMSMIEEIHYDTPIEQPPATTRPAGEAASPFVPSGVLAGIERSLAEVPLAQVTRVQSHAASRPAVATQPAAATVTTRPAPAAAPAASTQPAAPPGPVSPPPEAKPAVPPKPVPTPAAPARPVVADARTSANEEKAHETPKAKPAAPAGPNVAPVAARSDDRPMTDEERWMAGIYQAATDVRTTNEPQVLYDERQGTIIIIGQESQVEEIEKLLDTIIEEVGKLDKAAKADIRVFRVQYIDVTVAATFLEQLFGESPAAKAAKAPKPPQAAQRKPKTPAKPGEKGAQPGEEEEEGAAAERRREEEEAAAAKEAEAAAEAAALGAIKVVPDPRTNTLIIKAAPETFPKIAEVLLKIDRPGTGPLRNIRIFQLKKLNAAEVEEVLKEILKIQSPRQPSIRARFPGRGFGPGMGGAIGADMLEMLQQEFELQQTAAMAGANAGAEGEGKEGKTKINPSKDISIASEAMTNSIIVTAPEEGMQLVETLINKLEEQEIPILIETIELRHAEADKVASQLEKVFETTTRRSAAGGMGRGMDGYTPSRMGDFKVSADSRTNRLVVRALKPDMERIREIVTQLDSTPSNPVYIYPVNEASAEELSKALTEMYGSGAQAGGAQAVRITAERATNSILVRAPEPQQILIAAKIKELDQQVQSRSEVREIQLKVATATTVASQLNKIFGAKGASRGVRQQITIEGDDASKMLFVTCPPEQFEEIKRVAEQMDQITEQAVEVRVLKYAAATDILPKLNEMAAKLIAQTGLRGSSDAVFAASADERTNSLIIAGTPKALMVVKTVIDQLDVEGSDKTQPTTKMFPLNRGQAASVAATINSLYGTKRWHSGAEAPKAAADPSANVVFVTGTAAQLDLIDKTIIAPLEGYSPTPPPAIAVNDYEVTVNYYDVEELAAKLTTLFNQRQQNRKLAGDTSLTPTDMALSIVPEPSTRKLFISCSEKSKAMIDQWLKTLDVEGVTGVLQQTRVIPIRFADLNYTVQALTTAFRKTGKVPPSEQVTILPEFGTNAIIIRALKKDMDQIVKLLEEIDVEDRERLAAPEAIPVKHVLPSQLAARLTAMIRSLYALDKRTGQYPVSVEPNDAAGTVLVTAKTKQGMDSIKTLIAQLDSRPADDDRTTRPYVLKFADLTSTMNSLNKRFGRQDQLPLRDQVAVEPDYATGALVVTASEEKHKAIEEMITALDQSDVAGRQSYTVELKNADPEDVAQTLTTIYASGPRSRTGRAPVVFTAVPGTRNLLVTCTPAELDQAKALIDQLDVSQKESEKRGMRVVLVKKLPAREMMLMLTEYLRKPGKSGSRDPSLQDDIKITASDTADAVVLTGPEERLDELEQLIEKVDGAVVDTSDPKAGGRRMAVIPLTNADPSSVAQVITQTYQARGNVPESEKVTAVAERATNSVVVSASAEKLEMIRQMIADLDQESSNVPQEQIIRLKNARAEDLVDVLQQTYRTGRRGAGQGPPITFAADPNGNALVVSAGKADLEGVKTMIAELDKPATENAQELRIIPLQYVDADETLTIMTEYLRKSGAPTGRRGAGSDLMGGIRLQASPTLNALIASGSTEELDRVQKIALDLDKQVEGAGAPKVIKVEHANASSLAATLTEIFTKPAERRSGGRTGQDAVPLIMGDEGTNSLVVRARPQDFTLIEEMVKRLDTKPEGLTGLEVITVSRGVDVAALARQIEETIRRGESAKQRTQKGYTPREVAVGYDERASALIVSGAPEMFDTVRKLVTELDQKRGDAGGRRALVVPVKTKSAQDIQRVLDQFIEAQTGKRR